MSSKKKPQYKPSKCGRCGNETLLLQVPYYGLLCGECIERYIDKVLFPHQFSDGLNEQDVVFRDTFYDVQEEQS